MPKLLSPNKSGATHFILPRADARDLGLVDGDVVRLTAGKLILEAPVLVRAGQAARTIAATLGYGRTAAGSIGNNVGFDVYPLRRADSPWAVANVTINLTGEHAKSSAHATFFRAGR